MRTVTSELLQVPGIGPSKRRLLLQTFGSVQGVRDASVEQIAALPGFSAASAQRLLEGLANSDAVAAPQSVTPSVPIAAAEGVAPIAPNDDLSPPSDERPSSADTPVP
jgi:excinuclease ABC subunit C